MKSKRVFYGWWVVLTAAVALFWGAPVTVFSFSVFLKPLMRDFHASRGAISLAYTLGGFAAAVSAPLTGWLVDRWGARRVVLPATAMFGAILLLAKVLPASIWQFYVFYLSLGFLINGVGPVPYGYVVAHWFDRRRGLALGLMMFGIGAGAMIMPLFAQKLIAGFGWRNAYVILGSAAVLIPLPIVAAFLEEKPADVGLRADGVPPADPETSVQMSNFGVQPSEVWRTRTFQLMLGSFFLIAASVHGCAVHLVAMLTDRGISFQTAAVGSSVAGAAILLGRAGTGYLLDRFFAPYVSAIFFGGVALGIALLWIGGSTGICFAGAFLVGLGLGAEVDIIAFLISRYFGMRCFGQIYSFAFGGFLLAGATGPLVMGAGFDWTGSYTAPLALLLILSVTATALITRLGPYPHQTKPASRNERAPGPQSLSGAEVSREETLSGLAIRRNGSV
jgi:MFS family permease